MKLIITIFDRIVNINILSYLFLTAIKLLHFVSIKCHKCFAIATWVVYFDSELVLSRGHDGESVNIDIDSIVHGVIPSINHAVTILDRIRIFNTDFSTSWWRMVWKIFLLILKVLSNCVGLACFSVMMFLLDLRDRFL